ncbi:hypothetical protein GY45DRAFT_1358661 [Cubamyces sp. BRFM 1775]|nr:hypothetical protein GY45DRAFT_1358661 [Cubamyces sp. BRFM 1775]
MDRPASALRRKSQVFVEIPPSPFLSSKSGNAHPRIQPETPLKAVTMNVDHVEPSSPPSITNNTPNGLKRKSMGTAQDYQEVEAGVQAKTKKQKTNGQGEEVTHGKKSRAKRSDHSTDAQGETVRCHQCTRQVVHDAAIHCSSLRPSGQQCVLKYCRACMRNRYQAEIDDIKVQGSTGITDDARKTHAAQVPYIFRCPRCSGSCNCRICRKAQGLPATGDMNMLARKAAKAEQTTATDAGPYIQGVNGAAHRPAMLPKPKPLSPAKQANTVPSTGSGPRGKPKPHVLIPPSPQLARRKSDQTSNVAPMPQRRAARPKRDVVPKAIPKPIWTRMSTPLTHEDALLRLNIREFMMRFSHLTDTARGHLEELEELGCKRFGSNDLDNDGPTSGGTELVAWVSEPAIKAILIGLLTLLSKDPDMDEDSSALVKAVHSIKSSGVNLNKMWAALSSLRDDSSISLPDPLPLATSGIRHSTRNAGQGSSRAPVAVFATAQLVPIVDALIARTIHTKAVREDFERAVAQEKELARAARERTADENARWKSASDADKGVNRAAKRAARLAHQNELLTIEHALKVASAECMPRFGPLGRDAEGRVYYALTPGVAEREAAFDILEDGTGEVNFGKRRGVADEAQRKGMRHWSWFLAVWGRKPEGADVSQTDDEEDGDEDEVENPDAEGWWGFWQPEEVAKLSEWLGDKYSVKPEAKRLSKESDDVAVIDEDSTQPRSSLKPPQRQGRPSGATSAGETSMASRPGVRSFASLDRESDSEDEVSSIADSSDGEDEGQSGQMRLDARGEPVPRRQDLKILVKSLKEYADLLEWRIKRASRETKESKEDSQATKGKGVQKDDAIPPQSFYGSYVYTSFHAPCEDGCENVLALRNNHHHTVSWVSESKTEYAYAGHVQYASACPLRDGNPGKTEYEAVDPRTSY